MKNIKAGELSDAALPFVKEGTKTALMNLKNKIVADLQANGFKSIYLKGDEIHFSAEEKDKVLMFLSMYPY